MKILLPINFTIYSYMGGGRKTKVDGRSECAEHDGRLETNP